MLKTFVSFIGVAPFNLGLSNAAIISFVFFNYRDTFYLYLILLFIRVFYSFSPIIFTVMKYGIVVFPGSNCDRDMQDALQSVLKKHVVMLWHKSKDISMFTTGEDKPVSEIMKSIFDKENGGPSIDAKADDKAMAAYFESVLPEYDKERVYTSNMRKLFTWYNGLQSTGNLKVKSDETKDEATEKIEKAATEKKAAIKKTATKDTTKSKTSTGVKKTAGVRKTGVA